MNKRLPLAVMFAFLMLLAPARAEEMTSRVETSTQDGVTVRYVNFEFESCGGECQVATLTCGAGSSIAVDLADVDAKNVAKAMVKEKDQMVVTAGKTSVGYFISKMQFQEMTGSWSVEAYSQDEKAPKLATAIAGAKTIVAQVGGQTVTLPVDKKVQDWAKGCG